jgi:hypothetical protein
VSENPDTYTEIAISSKPSWRFYIFVISSFAKGNSIVEFEKSYPGESGARAND